MGREVAKGREQAAAGGVVTRFEYKVVELYGKRENHEYILNVEGESGWELVSVMVPGGVLVAGLGRIVAYLRRPKRSQAARPDAESETGHHGAL